MGADKKTFKDMASDSSGSLQGAREEVNGGKVGGEDLKRTFSFGVFLREVGWGGGE